MTQLTNLVINQDKERSNVILSNFEKSHVKNFTRVSKSGKMEQVKEHEDKRTKKEKNDITPHKQKQKFENVYSAKDAISEAKEKHRKSSSKHSDNSEQAKKDVKEHMDSKLNREKLIELKEHDARMEKYKEESPEEYKDYYEKGHNKVKAKIAEYESGKSSSEIKEAKDILNKIYSTNAFFNNPDGRIGRFHNEIVAPILNKLIKNNPNSTWKQDKPLVIEQLAKTYPNDKLKRVLNIK